LAWQIECLFVGSTSQSVRLRLQPSVELAPVPGSAIIDPDRHFIDPAAIILNEGWTPPRLQI
jgi:hypothetical protein